MDYCLHYCFENCFITVWIVSNITVFCLRESDTVIDCLQHVLSRVRSGNLLSASLCACEIACNAPPYSTMTRDFCIVLVYSSEQTSIWPSWARSDSDNGRNETEGFFSATTSFNLCGCDGVAATGGTRRAHNCVPVEDILVLADPNHITWAPSVPCCLLLRPPVSRLGTLQTLPSKTKELQNYHSQSPSALTQVPTTVAFFNGV